MKPLLTRPGNEFFSRPFNNRLSGTLSYTLSRSLRRIGGQDVPSSFDRTHVLNATAGYNLGAGFNFSTRLLLYSGLPVRLWQARLGRMGKFNQVMLSADCDFWVFPATESDTFMTSVNSVAVIHDLMHRYESSTDPIRATIS